MCLGLVTKSTINKNAQWCVQFSRLSNRLCSVPEEASAVLTRDGRERARVDEDRRRISTAGVGAPSHAAQAQPEGHAGSYPARVVKSSEHLPPSTDSFASPAGEKEASFSNFISG